ncbi:hypothetical protein ACJU26_08320 [Acidithiobacillus sp. M4-SHS-6]
MCGWRDLDKVNLTWEERDGLNERQIITLDVDGEYVLNFQLDEGFEE